MSNPESRQPNTSQNINCGNVSGSYNNIWNNCDFGVTDERRDILEWLSPLAPRLRHRDVRGSQVEGVGDWLLRKEEFINWNTSEAGVASPVLFCYGDPGVGKTHISSLVIETLCHQSIGKQVAVACLYCDFSAHKEQSTAHMLGAILKQVATGWKDIPQEIEAQFQRSKRDLDGRELESAEILKLLISTLRTLERSYICVDGLDEFPEEYQPDLFKLLAQITRESPATRLFMTGRQHIREEVARYFTRMAEIRIIPSREDIKEYISLRLRKDARPQIMNDSLREEILTTIPKKISEIFLLVSLSMNEILAQSTVRARRERLRQMTSGKGTDGVYAATLERIMAQDGDQGELGMRVLMWVSRSERQLGEEELCHALGIEEDSTDLDPENVPAIETLLSCCLGLVSVDEEGSRVRLIHLTLQEYLGGRPDLFGSAHSQMAEACLTYLNFQSIKDLPPTLEKPPHTTPFLHYSSCYWGVHAAKQLSELTVTLALQLLDEYDHHVAARMLLVDKIACSVRTPTSRESGTGGLHAIACFGVAEIATAMIKSDSWDVDMRDCLSHTPLLWAARNNNREVCEVLLEVGGADPNIGDEEGQTPLHVASAAGDEGIVKLLLERKEVNPGSSNNYGGTPLWWAAHGGHEGIVKLLLKRKEVNPDSSNKYGVTPLSNAAEGGHKGIVKLLLERKEVNPDSSDWWGNTPLLNAAWRGHGGIVKLLLDRKGVNPSSSTKRHGRTPLLAAAEGGHEGIVKLLLERREVNPDSSDKSGETPLLNAAWKGHEGIVKLLLERKEVNPDSSDESGQTPLLKAAEGGHEGIVKLLLERKEVNPGSSDNYGQTPLLLAASGGHEGIVKLLLERKEVNPDSPDKSGETPLLKAAEGGHEGIVKLLLERNEVNPDSSDENGQKPLLLAASGGHEGIVKLLLERKEVNPDSSDESGQTPLLAVAEGGHEGLVKLLLERKEVNPASSLGSLNPHHPPYFLIERARRTSSGWKNWADWKGYRIPLLAAAWKGHEGIVKLLLERKEVNPDSSDKSGQTPLLKAAEGGREGIVKLLLERKEVNPNPCDNDSTPLSLAALNGHKGIVKLLLKRKEVNPDSSNRSSQMPLFWATREGHEGIVKLLLERKDFNPASSNYDGRTPLLLATEGGHEGIVKLLLERKEVCPNSADRYGQTPLLEAAERGHQSIVKLLLERKEVNPNSCDNGGNTPLSVATEMWHKGIVRLLQERLSADSNL